MENKNLTGYPSIDKPWLKYYNAEAIKASLPECTIYEYLYENNKNHLNEVAIEYFGRKITYRDLFISIKKTACAFTNIGISKGDIIPIMAVNLPEVIYCIYALNIIGAIPNMIDPRIGAQGLEKYLKETHSSTLIALDACFESVNDIVRKSVVERVIIISVTNSLLFPLNHIIRIKNPVKLISDNRITLWKKFVSKSNSIVKKVKYHKNRPAIIVHTGGTTGKSKGVVLSNDNINAAAHQVKYTNFGLERNDIYLNILVPFVAYGISLGIHTPLSLGWHSILIPKFETNDIAKLMKKYKPYYGHEDETRNIKKKHNDGNVWIHTGDIGYVTENGFIYVVDRIKRMIIRQGFKVFPSEIENALLNNANVLKCAVVGVRDSREDTVPIAYIVLKNNDVDVSTLTNELNKTIEKHGLPPYYIPKAYKYVEDLPLTKILKVDYKALEKIADEKNY